MLDEVINEIRAEMEAQGRSDEFVGAKVSAVTCAQIWYDSKLIRARTSGYLHHDPFCHTGRAAMVA